MKSSLSSQRIDEIKWGGLTVGSNLGEITPIFPRLDKKAVIEKIFLESGAPAAGAEAKPEKATAAGASAKSTKPQPTAPAVAEAKPAVASVPDGKITIDDFAKVELRVAQVVSAERVPGADKLLKLIVDVGSETRQILAGIAKAYSPENLVGRKIVIVANLQPRKMRGLESNGMLLAASVGDEGQPVLASFLEDVPNGAKLK